MFFIFLLVSGHLHSAIAKRQHLSSYIGKANPPLEAFDLDTRALERFLMTQKETGDVQDFQPGFEGVSMHFEIGSSVSVVGNSVNGPFSAFISPRDGIVQRTLGTQCVEYHFESVPTILGMKSPSSFEDETFFTASNAKEGSAFNSQSQRIEVAPKEFRLENVLREYSENPVEGSGIAAVLINLVAKLSNGPSLLEVSISLESVWYNIIMIYLVIFTVPVGAGLIVLCNWAIQRFSGGPQRQQRHRHQMRQLSFGDRLDFYRRELSGTVRNRFPVAIGVPLSDNTEEETNIVTGVVVHDQGGNSGGHLPVADRV